MSGGRKDDAAKVQLELLSPAWLLGVGQVLTFGAKKYAAHNWRLGIARSRLLGACLRHVLAYLAGEDHDPETGLLHLHHASCCLMFASELHYSRPDLDDRYKKPVNADDVQEVAAWAKEQPDDPEEHWSVRLRKKFEACGEKPPEGLIQEIQAQEDVFEGKHYDKPRCDHTGIGLPGCKICDKFQEPEIHQNHEPETHAELETASIMASENKPTVEEVLAQKWAETGVEHCRCCFMPRQDCLTRSWMNP